MAERSNGSSKPKRKLVPLQRRTPKTVASVSLQRRFNGGFTVIERTLFRLERSPALACFWKPCSPGKGKGGSSERNSQGDW